MDHFKSSFSFKSDQDVWCVEYTDRPGKWMAVNTAQVYLNNELYWDFDTIPNTQTQHPTKTQAKEIISKARKEFKLKNKVMLNRDKQLNKLLK